MSECNFCSFWSKLNFFFSSFTGASNARFDRIVETSMTFSTSVVCNIWCLGTFNFLESKAIAQCHTTDVEKVILVSTIPSNLALDAPVNEEKKKFNLIETEQK